MSWLANICYLIAGAVYGPVLAYQMAFQGKNRRGWWERFGHTQPRKGDRPCVWIHAVSVGEVNATQSLIKQIRSKHQDVELVISTTTDTGYARAKSIFPDLSVFRYPLDFSWVVRRALKRIRPDVIVLMELEVWYNLATIASRLGIKVCVANGRFTHRSARRLSLLGPIVRPMFASLAWVGAQTQEIAERFKLAGVQEDRIDVLGSMKWDTAIVAEQVEGQGALALAMGLDKSRPLIVLGSSGPGEEKIVIEAVDQLPADIGDPQLAIVPRKPERFAEVQRLIEKKGRICLKRSELPDECLPPSNTSRLGIFLGDTMGELRKFYGLSDVVIVGRTFVPLGGSDLMEVAALGKSIIIGPHSENFAEPVARLRAANAVSVLPSAKELSTELGELLRDETRRRRMGEQARRVVRENQGTTSRTAEKVMALLGQAS